MNNKELERIASDILKKTNLYYTEPDKFGSVIAILMIISIILTCIRAIQECNKNKITGFGSSEKISFYNQNIKTLSVNKNWFTKMKVKKILRKELKIEDYKAYGNLLTNAILEYGENLTEEDTSIIMEAANV